ncbi:unnamed protein product [Mytilus coruscus]|uniref:Uncharacterized protein n=1 Tax=Mytilus coruscus TaxID=42192 RepID=A0A6J8DDR3_MYTCO|nr:unnamed protein product [Mytilus coruscus]
MLSDKDALVLIVDTGFKVNDSNFKPRAIFSREKVVSFFNVSQYVPDSEIREKLQEFGAELKSPIKRKMHPGTEVANGTRNDTNTDNPENDDMNDTEAEDEYTDDVNGDDDNMEQNDVDEDDKDEHFKENAKKDTNVTDSSEQPTSGVDNDNDVLDLMTGDEHSN